MAWPSTWTDRRDRDRTPSIPGHELAGVVTALGYGTTGLSVGLRVFGLADWHRDGTLAEYVAIEARNLAPLPGDVDFTVGASLPISGLTAWQGLFQHGRLQAGQSVLAHGAAGAVGYPSRARTAEVQNMPEESLVSAIDHPGSNSFQARTPRSALRCRGHLHLNAGLLFLCAGFMSFFYAISVFSSRFLG
jgi:D-arabinose 1-dehydrogenase-like Zn-dependent alcohol dehydrogenase